MLATLIVSLVLAVFAIVVLVLGVRLLKKNAERDQARIDFWREAYEHLRGVLVGIRDSGPTGPDPLPPCQWCGQASGHWGSKRDAKGYWIDVVQDNPKCPAVVAWRELIGR